MTDTIQQALLDMCVQVDGEVGFRNDYSGHGMYGRSCVGIAGDRRNCMQIIAEVIRQSARLASNDDPTLEEVVDTLLNFEQDSMGYDVIIYWPDLKPIENPED